MGKKRIPKYPRDPNPSAKAKAREAECLRKLQVMLAKEHWATFDHLPVKVRAGIKDLHQRLTAKDSMGPGKDQEDLVNQYWAAFHAMDHEQLVERGPQ